MYSLEAASLGQVLHAKQIRAAHCLTSVQFSPTSEHLLLAYGRSAFVLYMHAFGHSLMHSGILLRMRACMLSCFLSCICSCFPFNPDSFLPSAHFLLFFVILLCDTCLPQKAEQCSESPSLVLRMALQTSVVNASALITASKPVDAS